jgi:glycolate oxidase FAD binding subunit
MAGLLGACAGACPGGTRPAGPADQLDGVPAAVHVTPSCLDHLSGLLRATGPAATIAVVGGATKTGLGAPPTGLDVIVSTARLDRVLEHHPDDLVVRAQAGMRLDALQQALAPSGQWLALDPPEQGATLAGIVAANASGPRRHRHGTARDLLIGVTAVLADGTVAHSGGKVVKNVAGYDLGKVLTGSLGTLAVLAELTFRLHPVPRARRSVTVATPSVADLDRLLACLRRSRLEPSAIEYTGDTADGRGSLTVLFEGPAAAVDTQARDAATLMGADAETADSPPDGFGAHPWDATALGLRVAVEPASLPRMVSRVGDLVREAGAVARIRAHAGVGVARVGVAGITDPVRVAALLAGLRAAAGPFDGSVVVAAASPPVKAALDVWGPVRGLEVMRRVKAQFDPHRRLSPGRFVGGI